MLGRIFGRCRWGDNIEMELKEKFLGCGLD
jgi:hypothetical protein